jgi:opacity protein-like surface antigen
MYGGSGDIACFFTMVNAWYDFTFMKYLIPYIGIGAGAGQVRIENFTPLWADLF